MRTGSCSTLIAAAVLLGACGGGSSSTQGNGTCTPGTSADVGIASTGVSPKATCVLPGGSVTFTNRDTVSHDVAQSASNASCTGLTLSIAAGQAGTAMFPTAATCTYDANSGHAGDAAFQGTVYVITAPATGPGH